jgi:hypothetical protein
MILCNKETETDEQFFARVKIFHAQLEELCLQYDSILLIGHAYYFNAWYYQACRESPKHAEIIELI